MEGIAIKSNAEVSDTASFIPLIVASNNNQHNIYMRSGLKTVSIVAYNNSNWGEYSTVLLTVKYTKNE